MKHRLEGKDWALVAEGLHRDGYAVVEKVLTAEECEEMIGRYTDEGLYRKTINMERYRFGLGEYKYFGYPLPGWIEEVREAVYAKLAPVANRWMEALAMEVRYPATHAEMKRRCENAGQTKPTVLILKYGEGGFNTLHQDLYGEVYFPMQVVLFLDEGYSGGEFVLTEQVPRAQSKANVVKPRRGDMLVFTTNFRPVKGSRGWYRVNMKHGVSPVRSGARHTLGIIFHDAES
ncbi:MAG: 2OG-Fe(II) oxygenase [Bacteroidetes bacterium]|nr:2OG-Fe(II) oxygenase [Bacteroidota bacterium]